MEASVGAGVELKETLFSVAPGAADAGAASVARLLQPDSRLLPARLDKGNMGALASICKRRRRDISGTGFILHSLQDR